MTLSGKVFLFVVVVIVAALTYRVVGWYFDVRNWPLIRHIRIFLGFAAAAPSKNAFHRRELMRVLLSLDESSIEDLLKLYRERYGAGAYRYARRTYQGWKSGSVRPVTQTFKRFLIDLPQVMSFDLKCEVLRRFMEEFAVKDSIELSVTIADWEEKLGPVVEQLIDRNYTLRLPAEVERRLRWLGENDMQAAAVILRRAMTDESRLAVSQLREEFANIELVFAEKGLRAKVRHEIKLPCGTITANVKRN